LLFCQPPFCDDATAAASHQNSCPKLRRTDSALRPAGAGTDRPCRCRTVVRIRSVRKAWQTYLQALESLLRLATGQAPPGAKHPHHARDGSTPMRALPMKRFGLNLAIPFAVRSAFAIQLSAWATPPTSGSHGSQEPCSGSSVRRAALIRGPIP